MIPAFAVVGHPNKGKSSIVATLAEDDDIAIGSAPGTTRHANRHSFTIDGEPQYVLIDTPGFQRARGVLDWLESREGAAHERAGFVEEFVTEHQGDERFHDECELLRPIVEGAGILYVVDGAKPYGPEYELEMQVLRWTGRPRMALINLIGAGDYIEEWRQALGQYFSIVRVFDAVHADFNKRVALLRAFAELEESWRAPLERAVAALESERRHRRDRCAQEIADSLVEMMTMTERAGLADDADSSELQARLTQRLQNRISAREQTAREVVQGVYRHAGLQGEEDASAARLLGTELFAREGWELFGLSHTQLLMSGVVSGAVAGAGVDAVLGGATLLLGAGIGAIVGGVGAWFGGDELARVKVLGQSLGGRTLQVGPVTNPNFPWVLLGRALVHHRVVAERNHARREALSLAVDQHAMDALPEDARRRLGGLFRALPSGEPGPGSRRALSTQIGELLEADNQEVGGSLRD
ncbi:MAG: GTPase/DUF3482 domain-containing protein [Gammaproteobacteria bacterium]|nr:GTPase/DUF3482 domain-containing protein [Gammaproteobacteria bacterium]